MNDNFKIATQHIHTMYESGKSKNLVLKKKKCGSYTSVNIWWVAGKDFDYDKHRIIYSVFIWKV